VAERVAVLLPFRDVAPWLDAAIASVRAERCVEQIVLVDDGSTDASASIAERHAEQDDRIALVRAGGEGIVAALELARSRTSARFLARMDGDDISLPGRIEQAVALLESRPALGAVGSRVQAFPEEHVAEGLRRYVAWQNALLTEGEHRDALFIEAPLCHPSVVLRASALASVGGYRDGPFPEDYDLWLRLDRAGHGLAKVPSLGLGWRHRPDRLTFRDARYSREAHRKLKAGFLAERLGLTPRATTHGVAVWGAGPTGRRLARELETHGVGIRAFLDIDPDKIGRTRRGVPVHDARWLDRAPRPFVLIAVGARGARDIKEGELTRRGLESGEDFLAAS
jgi:glycosyltransferase involved in cell wall biosynthesis